MYFENELFNNSQSYETLSKREVRSLIIHILYAVEAVEYQDSIMSIVDNFNRGFGMSIPANSTVVKTVEAIVDQKESLDQSYIPFLDNWKPERLSIMVKLILRYAVWEIDQKELDPKIIINEAIELAKQFAEKDAYKFINGILDKYIKKD